MKSTSLKLMSGVATALLISFGAATAQDTDGSTEQGLQNQQHPAVEGQAETQGQMNGQQEMGTQSQGQADSQDGMQQQSQESGATDMQSTSPDVTQNTTNRAKDVNITAENKTVIRQTIVQSNVEPVNDVDFNVTVGVAVPATVTLHPLPVDIVAVVPEYEGYDFFLLADGRIVIVDPATLTIVTIIA